MKYRLSPDNPWCKLERYVVQSNSIITDPNTCIGKKWKVTEHDASEPPTSVEVFVFTPSVIQGYAVKLPADIPDNWKAVHDPKTPRERRETRKKMKEAKSSSKNFPSKVHLSFPKFDADSKLAVLRDLDEITLTKELTRLDFGNPESGASYKYAVTLLKPKQRLVVKFTMPGYRLKGSDECKIQIQLGDSELCFTTPLSHVGGADAITEFKRSPDSKNLSNADRQVIEVCFGGLEDHIKD